MKTIGAFNVLSFAFMLIVTSFSAAWIAPASAQTVPSTLQEAQRATALGRERLVDGDIEGAETAVKEAPIALKSRRASPVFRC